MAYVAGTPPKPPDKGKTSFFDMHAHGFARVATAVPRVALCDPRENAARIEKLYKEACAQQSAVCCFPELCVSGYALDDLLSAGVEQGLNARCTAPTHKNRSLCSRTCNQKRITRSASCSAQRFASSLQCAASPKARAV